MRENPVRVFLFVLICVFLGLSGGCEALQQAKEERAQADREELEARYAILAKVFANFPSLETLSEGACDDPTIESTGKGRHPRSRRRLPSLDAMRLTEIIGEPLTAPVSEWAVFRSGSVDRFPPRDALGRGDSKTQLDADIFFESRYVVLYLNTLGPEEDAQGDFHGWMAVIDLEKAAPVCQVVLESEPRTSLSRTRKGDRKYAMQETFRQDANAALAKITELFEVR